MAHLLKRIAAARGILGTSPRMTMEERIDPASLRSARR
jgi:hypothetical protein